MIKLIICLICNTLLSNDCNLIDVTKFGYEQYQNIVINGQILKNMPTSNSQQPEKRYVLIDDFLKNYSRPFTMLDLGAAQGYHSLLSAWKYPDSVFVMIEGNNKHYPLYGDQLLSICKCNNKLNNIIHLNKSLYLGDLFRLGECEHFDIILALNIIHWLGDDWKLGIQIITKLGDNIIIETPNELESPKTKEIIEYLNFIGAIKIADVPRHTKLGSSSPVFLIQNLKNKILDRSTWMHNYNYYYEVISNFQTKKLKKIDNGKEVFSDWIPGINLMTFKMYNGCYPLTNVLNNQLELLKEEKHNDWNPNNFIVQGNKLKMIDYQSSYYENAPEYPVTYERFDKMIEFLEEKDYMILQELFWKVVRSTR